MSEQAWKGAEEDVEVQGKVSHQPCLEVSLTQVTAWKGVFFTSGLVFPREELGFISWKATVQRQQRTGRISALT